MDQATHRGLPHPEEPVDTATAPTDADLLGRCADGDQRAWAQIVDRYAGLVVSIPRRQGLPADACDDIAQIVFTLLVRHLDRLVDPQSLAKWLIVTTRRECWRRHRRAARRAAFESDVDAEPREDDEHVARLERQQHVRWALRELGGRCEKLLTALFLEESEPAYAEIARRLDIPMGSIGPTRLRCLARLAALLGDPEDATSGPAGIDGDVSAGLAADS